MTRKRRRFTPEFKAQVVLDVLAGEQSTAEACRSHGLSPTLLSLWKATILQRVHAAFQAEDQRGDEQARIAELERMVGRLTLEREILQRLDAAPWPLDGKREAAMTLAADSPAVAVCDAFGLPQSTFYAQSQAAPDQL